MSDKKREFLENMVKKTVHNNKLVYARLDEI